LVLRRQGPEDAQLIKEAVDTSLAHLRASVAWAQSAPTPLSALEARLATSAAAFDAGEAWAFTIFDSTESRVLGGVSLEPAEPALAVLAGSDAVETGYWLRADATGHGYATEATAALTELAFTQLGARRVVVCHDPENAASEGVPRRLGFRCMGTVADAMLPGRQAADGSVRPATKVWVRDGGNTSRETMMQSRWIAKVFLLTWFSFAFFFVSVIAPLNADLGRSRSEWLLRGVIGGFVVAALTAYVERRRQARAAKQPLPSEELKL
jgi:RimJ/RimL family protein N-acetyltransferase